MKLNLGCGSFKKEGFLNIDWNANTNPDLCLDLNKHPLPLEDNAFDEVWIEHTLEHLDEPFEVMREIHRLARPGGKVVVRVPHFSRGFSHPEHKRGFDFSFPLYFNPKFEGGFQGVEFKLEDVKFVWFGQPELKRQVLNDPAYFLGFHFGRVVDFFANHAPLVWSRLFCFWVGGFDEISFIFRAVK